MERPSTQELIEQARQAEAQQPSGRLPVPAFASWATFPFEGELTARQLADPVLPEPARHGAGGVDCHACQAPDDDYLWADGSWRVRATREPTGLPVVLLLEPRAHHDLADLPPHLVQGLGPAIQRVEAALLSLGGMARVQMVRWGDGSEHLHLWFFPRPEGFVQGRGSFLSMWDDVLPPRPEAEWRATLADVSAALRG